MHKGSIYVLSTYILWGLLPAYWKLLQGLDALFILSHRAIWSFVLTSIFCLAVGPWRRQLRAAWKDRSSLPRLFLASLFCLLNWGSYIYAVNSGQVIDASLAYYLNPILSVFIAAFVFKERLTPVQSLAIALASLAVAYSFFASSQGPILALIIGGSWAVYGAIKKKTSLEGLVSLNIEMTFLLFPMLLLCSFLWSQGSAANLSGLHALLLPTTGIVTALPMVLYANGIKSTPYARAGILMYINPSLQLLLGIFLFGEAFSKTDAVTFIGVWLVLILYLWGEFQKHSQRRPLSSSRLE